MVLDTLGRGIAGKRVGTMLRKTQPGWIAVRLIAFTAVAITVGMLVWACTDEKPPEPVIPPISTNNPPVAYEAFVTAASFTSGSKVLFDLRYREHGCNAAGDPVWLTGAEDPDGDPLEYKVECNWTAFNQDREKINGQWVGFPHDDKGEQVALVTVFVGWDQETPPYPFSTMSASGCDPGATSLTFSYSVRDAECVEASCPAVTYK